MPGHICGSCQSHHTQRVNVTTIGDPEEHFVVTEHHEDGSIDASVPAVEVTEPSDSPLDLGGDE